MTTRVLKKAPGTFELYARAAAPLVPGASLLPFVGGRGRDLPDLSLVQRDIVVDPRHLATYAHVCAFTLRDRLPITYPHVLAFPLHMALMTDSSFPFPAVGLVHIENRIVQHRGIDMGEPLAVTVRFGELSAHAKGRQFAIFTEVRVADELVWEGESTMLRRGGGEEGSEPGGAGAASSAAPAEVPMSSEWRLPGDLGRRYGAASGDRNPIHMRDLAARLFGFPRAIAHGMWTKARCLSALEARVPDAAEVAVRFRRPILLPGTVAFGVAEEPDGALRFAVRDAREGAPHLDGAVTPAA